MKDTIDRRHERRSKDHFRHRSPHRRIAAVMLLALLVLTAVIFVGCGDREKADESAGMAIAADSTDRAGNGGAAAIEEDGEYTDSDDVALYIHTYKHLPGNYITKSEARDCGWRGGNPTDQCAGKSIGGDVFGNREGTLPEIPYGEKYYECDVNYHDDSRGDDRLVFTENGAVYFTSDHYNTFEQLYE